ncbi:MFS transporter [Sporobolomyces koalae]|uniref:MFS transporter n=1 Tax=Sporobolomyces koalae TaxID=500713 RepID=UPI003180EEA1
MVSTFEPANSNAAPCSDDFRLDSTRHESHQRDYPEAELSSTAVVWDEQLRQWRSRPDEAGSDATTVAAVPRLDVATGNNIEKGTSGKEGTVWVEWDGPHDPENPFNWSDRKKWTTCLICCYFTLLVAFCGTAFGSGSSSMIRDLSCSEELGVMGLSFFPLGFGLGPLFTAPLSEALGRYPVYATSSLLYLIFFIPIAQAPNIGTVIGFRFLQGLAGSAGSTLVGGTVSDLFEAHNRGTGMAVFTICAFAGTGLGPAVSGYIEFKKGWRWIEWVQMMFAGLLAFAIILFTRETRGSVILSRRAKKLRKETGDERYQCRSDAERASLAVLLKVSMTRPLYLLATESIVFFFSLWAGFSWGCLYLLVEAVPLIFGNVYDFNIGEVGLTFYSVVVATFAGFLMTKYFQERMYRNNVARIGPEARLYASLIGGLLFPAGALILAFSQGRGHWFGPVFGLFLIFWGVFQIYLAVFTYLADCYTIYAASALSGQSLFRNLAAFAFPLFTRQMYSAMGYQWASFLAAMVALALAATPFVLMRYGPSIRAKSKFAKELARLQGLQ